jgi:ankyrin repeat protein
VRNNSNTYKRWADVNYVDQNKKFPLFHAYENKMFAQMKILVSCGANINQKYCENSILTAECDGSNPDPEMIKFLLENGLDPNFCRDGSDHVLLKLVNKNLIDCTLVLLSYPGINIDTQNMLGITACRIACARNYNILAHILLCKGADPNIQSKDSFSPLMKCIQEKNIQSITTLISHPTIKLDLQNNDGNTALHYACNNSCSHTVYQLLFNGSNQTIKNNKGKIAFEYCDDDLKQVFKIYEQLQNKKEATIQLVNKKEHKLDITSELPRFRIFICDTDKIKQGTVGQSYQIWDSIFGC